MKYCIYTTVCFLKSDTILPVYLDYDSLFL